MSGLPISTELRTAALPTDTCDRAADVIDTLYGALAEIAEGGPCDRDHWSAAIARVAIREARGEQA